MNLGFVIFLSIRGNFGLLLNYGIKEGRIHSIDGSKISFGGEEKGTLLWKTVRVHKFLKDG